MALKAIRDLQLDVLLGPVDGDAPKAAKARQAAFNALVKERQKLLSRERRAGTAAARAEVADAARCFGAAYANRRVALRGHGIEIPELPACFAGDAESGAYDELPPPAPGLDRGLFARPLSPAPSPPPPPGQDLSPEPSELYAAPPPLKLATGLKPAQHIEDGVEQVFCEAAAARGVDPLSAGIDAVIEFLNEHFVHLTHVDRIMYLMPPVWGAVDYQYVTADPKRLYPMLGSTQTRLAAKPLVWAKVWLASKARRKAMYANILPPRFPGDTEAAPPGVFNMWSGHAIPLDRARAAGGRADGPGARALQEFVAEAFVDHTPEEVRWLLSWLAHCVQCPGELPRVAPVLSGDEGAGKGALVSLVAMVLGYNYYSHPAGMDQVMGRFANTEGKLLVFADEVVWKGDMAGQEVLKKIITEEVLAVERKGVDSYTIRNCAHLVIATNHDQAVITSTSSRRFAHYHLTGGKRDLRHLFAEAAVNDIAVFLHTFDRVKRLDRETPRGAALYEQRLRSLRGVDRFLANAIHAAGGESETITFGDECAKSRIQAAYLAGHPDKRHAEAPNVFWMDVKKRITYETFRRGHAGCNAMAKFPPLAESSRQLAEFLGIPASMLIAPDAPSKVTAQTQGAGLAAEPDLDELEAQAAPEECDDLETAAQAAEEDVEAADPELDAFLEEITASAPPTKRRGGNPAGPPIGPATVGRPTVCWCDDS